MTPSPHVNREKGVRYQMLIRWPRPYRQDKLLRLNASEPGILHPAFEKEPRTGLDVGFSRSIDKFRIEFLASMFGFQCVVG